MYHKIDSELPYKNRFHKHKLKWLIFEKLDIVLWRARIPFGLFYVSQ